MAENPNVKTPLEALSRERFGGRTYIRESVISVPTTQTVVIPEDHNRLFWIMINEGANDVRLSNSAPVSATSGWLLKANGGLVSMFWEEDGEAVGYRVFGLAVGASNQIRIREVVRS